MLVDTDGKIVFKGHPANRKDLEAILILFSREKKSLDQELKMSHLVPKKRTHLPQEKSWTVQLVSRISLNSRKQLVRLCQETKMSRNMHLICLVHSV